MKKIDFIDMLKQVKVVDLVVILYENRSSCDDFETAIEHINLDVYGSDGKNILYYFALYATQYNLDKARFLNLFLSKGLDIDTQQTKGNGYTPLHIAVLRKDIELCKLLIENGANIESESASGNSPLFVAVMDYRGENGSIITFLIEKGADISHRNKFGHSPVGMSDTIANYDLKQFFQ
jgi:hypothetical protein